MKTVCIIQARMGSTRLPGKVAMDIAGRPMLARVVERARLIPGVDQVVVATSVLPGDDPLAKLAGDIGVACIRGSESDVLSRYALAAEASGAEAVVRVTSDCPLLDPLVSGRVVQAFHEGHPDYASNTQARSYPRGLDTEILTTEALLRAHRDATESRHREHVTIYVWSQPELFRLISVVNEVDHSAHRWTVDTPEDLELVRRVYRELGDHPFGMKQVLALLADYPDWMQINAGIVQKKA